MLILISFYFVYEHFNNLINERKLLNYNYFFLNNVINCVEKYLRSEVFAILLHRIY